MIPKTDEQTRRERLPMLCLCSDRGKQHVADVRWKARKILGRNYETEGLEERFLSVAIDWLWFRHAVELKFAVDQWYGVYAYRLRRDDDDHYDLYLSQECDRAEDGICGLIVWLDENDKWTWEEDD